MACCVVRVYTERVNRKKRFKWQALLQYIQPFITIKKKKRFAKKIKNCSCHFPSNMDRDKNGSIWDSDDNYISVLNSSLKWADIIWSWNLVRHWGGELTDKDTNGSHGNLCYFWLQEPWEICIPLFVQKRSIKAAWISFAFKLRS